MRIPSYRKHSSGQARVTIAGKDYLLGPHGSKKSKSEYNRLIAEYIASDRSASFGDVPPNISIIEVVDRYQKHAKVYFKSSPRTYAFVRLCLRPLGKLYGGDFPAVNFGVKEFRTVRRYVMDGNNRGPDAPPTETLPTRGYVNDVMNRIKRMFRWAAAEELISASVHETLSKVDPLKFGRTTAPEAVAVEAVDDSVVEATLPNLPKVIADMVRVQRLVGCRPGEVIQLTPGMIDRTGDVWLVTLEKHKTAHHGKERVLYIGIEAQEILKPYLLRGENDCLFRPCDSERQRLKALHDARVTPLSCGNTPGSNKKRKPAKKPGKAYSRLSYARAISRTCEAHGIPHWSPNQLRHAFAMQEGEDLETKAALMGHSNVRTTQVYAKIRQDKAIEATRRMSEASKKRNTAS